MVSEMITLRLEKDFLNEIDVLSKKKGYHTRAEFIREALRKKIETENLNERLIEVAKMKGAFKPTTDKSYRQIRKEAFKEIVEQLK